jgi:hypothetical protein
MGLVLTMGIGWLGTTLVTVGWWLYYLFYRTDFHAAKIMLIALVSSILLMAAAVRFLKFMERP